MASAPKFYSIQSSAHPGYYLTQRGIHVVLSALNKDNPYQLWYIDESWKYLGSCAVVLVNHGSKKALDAQTLNPYGQKVKVSSYDPTVKTDTLLWSVSGTFETYGRINVVGNQNLALAIGEDTKCPPPVDNIPAIVGDIVGDISSFTYGTQWKLIPYVPLAFNIQNLWATQNLTYKVPRTNVTLQGVAAAQNDELNVIAVYSGNNTKDDMIWYRVPAGGQEDTNDFTSFIIINKSTNLVLKGSTKNGEKVHLKEYDVLDYDFVWAENRAQNSTQNYVCINLSKTGSTNLHWFLPADDKFQNLAYYHPLTLLPTTTTDDTDRKLWKFIPVA